MSNKGYEPKDIAKIVIKTIDGTDIEITDNLEDILQHIVGNKEEREEKTVDQINNVFNNMQDVSCYARHSINIEADNQDVNDILFNIFRKLDTISYNNTQAFLDFLSTSEVYINYKRSDVNLLEFYNSYLDYKIQQVTIKKDMVVKNLREIQAFKDNMHEISMSHSY